MSSRSSRNGSEFEQAFLSALGLAGIGIASNATSGLAREAAEALVRFLGSRPTRVRRGIGGQWIFSVAGADRAVAIAVRSDDLRHPRPQGLPRALGFSPRHPASSEFSEAMRSAADRFREAAGPSGLFRDCEAAMVRRLYRDVNAAAVRWIDRHVAGDADLVSSLWVHTTGGAYVHVVARRGRTTIGDRCGLRPPRSVRLAPVDASRLLATFSNGDRIVLRLHTASGAYSATTQLSLKYAVTAAAATDRQEWRFDDESEEQESGGDDGDGHEAEARSGNADRSVVEVGGSNLHAGDCFELLACECLQQHFRVGGDAFTESAQARDRHRLPSLVVSTRDRLERAAALLAQWAGRKWGDLGPSVARRVVRLPDSAGGAGDNADVRIEGDRGQSLAFSLKHNNDVLKNHRPWTLPSQCGLASDSPEHARWPARLREIVLPTERRLVGGRVDQLPRDDRRDLYLRVTEAAAESIAAWGERHALRVGESLWRFLFGRDDTHVAIAWMGCLELRRYAAPSAPIAVGQVDALGSHLVVQFTSGHTTRWRVHTASSRHGGGQFPLKWDARATSAPDLSEVMPL